MAEIYVIAVYSLDEIKKHPKFKTDCFPLNITKNTNKEFGENSFPIAVPLSIWKEIKEENESTEYDPFENNFDRDFDNF